MPIQLGFMEPILPYGYFSVAFLTVLAALVIGAFWVGWGSPPPAKEEKDADSVPSLAKREEKTDSCADIAPVPAAREKMDALTEMAPTPAPVDKGKDAPVLDLCAALAVEGEKKIHELVEEAGVASVTGEAGEEVTTEETSLPAENRNELNGTTKPQATEKPEIGDMTLEGLKAYDGSDAERPLLMAIKGQIYDLSKSRNLYGPSGQYELFGGRDVTRALATMSFDPEDLNGNIDDLNEDDLEVLGDWEQKFMEKYPRVGKLVAAVKFSEGKDKQAA